jgi:hypothetical protein
LIGAATSESGASEVRDPSARAISGRRMLGYSLWRECAAQRDGQYQRRAHAVLTRFARRLLRISDSVDPDGWANSLPRSFFITKSIASCRSRIPRSSTGSCRARSRISWSLRIANSGSRSTTRFSPEALPISTPEPEPRSGPSSMFRRPASNNARAVLGCNFPYKETRLCPCPAG